MIRMMKSSVVLACIVVSTQGAEAQTPLTTTIVASGLSSPVMAKSPPGDTERLFIVERGGRVRLIKNGVLLATPFLDLTGQVQTHDERGMHDIAFHPNYAANGFFYVRYTDTSASNGRTIIRRFSRSANPDLADVSSAYTIFRVGSGLGFHLGGSMEFGRDGYLYFSVGDYTNPSNAQNINNYYGKILRIDVNTDAFPADPDANYAIPASNPFAGAIPGDDHIWSYGLRNPFRFSFDRITNAMWIGDVGQSEREEINFQPGNMSASNYGWPCLEGTLCWASQTSCSCIDTSLTAPIFEYNHNFGDCAVTGGRVYRGCAIPDLTGTYFLADFCTGRIWSFRYDKGQITELNPNRAAELDPPGPTTISLITGFGEDARGELYICSLNGHVFKIVPAIAPPDLNSNRIPDTCEFPVGDINRDGLVNVSDLLAVIAAWGPCFACSADIAPHPTGDGQVNVSDLLLVVANWG